MSSGVPSDGDVESSTLTRTESTFGFLEGPGPAGSDQPTTAPRGRENPGSHDPAGQWAQVPSVPPPSRRPHGRRRETRVKLKTLLLSAPFRLLWTVLLFVGANVVLDLLNIARAGRPGSVTWVYRNAAVAFGVFWFSVRLLEGKRLREAGLDPRRAPAELSQGFVLGAALVSTIVGALALVGAYRIDGLWPLEAGTTRLGWFGFTVLGLFLVGFAEELRNRGIL